MLGIKICDFISQGKAEVRTVNSHQRCFVPLGKRGNQRGIFMVYMCQNDESFILIAFDLSDGFTNFCLDTKVTKSQG